MPDWFEPAITLLPFAAWMFLGVGVPWALVLLPRERITVLAVGMALGPLGLTTIMFGLGTAGHLTLRGTLAGSAALSALGIGLAARRGLPSLAAWTARPAPFAPLEIVLIAGIVLIVLANGIAAAYWPFVEYDTQWVYGYNARLFVLHGRIPTSTGYYPQLVPLAYTYMQQAWGAFHDPDLNDHAARVILPWFDTAMILMAYVLGRRLFQTRRAGLLTAAIWAFYPHVAAWSGAGDLEIPLTLYTTGAAVFFIEAWRTGSARHAILSGVLLGGALWTKPTGGALALGMGLAVGVGLITARARWRAVLRIAVITGLASMPLGGMWYVHNLALGHAAVVFPASYWHDAARRSGQELGWPVLIAALVAGGLIVQRKRSFIPLAALALLLAGTLPTALNLPAITQDNNSWRWVRGDLFAARRLNTLEAACILAGFGLLGWHGRAAWRAWPESRRETIRLVWALLMPYAVVWFLYFSYHYRLSFAIAPLAAVQAAALIDGWLWDWLDRRRIGRAAGAAVVTGGIVLALAVGLEHTVTAWRAGLPDDDARYARRSPALMALVHRLEQYAAGHGDPVVAIPAEERLPFFFPEWDIRHSRAFADLPTRLEDLAGVDLYIDTSAGTQLLHRAGLWPTPLTADMAVGALYHELGVVGWNGQPWPTVLQPLALGPDDTPHIEDAYFAYDVFTVHPDARTAPMQPHFMWENPVIVGGFARLVGYDLRLPPDDDQIVLSLYWQPVMSAPHNHVIFIEAFDDAGKPVIQWYDPPLQGAYPVVYWQPGESLLDYHVLRLPEGIVSQPASLRIGIFDPAANARLPVAINGASAGDGVTIPVP